jgi:molybdopterin synthase sulfur carrier subunit
MELKVNFYATLRQIVGTKTAIFELPKGAQARELLSAMIERFPGLRPELLDGQGNLLGHVHFIINGRDVPYLQDQLDTVLQPDDIVSMFPAVGGG